MFTVYIIIVITEHAQSLAHQDRKEYAEKVVMAFWNAIGGDEQELVNDDSD